MSTLFARWLTDIFHMFLGIGTRPSSSEIDGRSTVASSQALQTEETVTRFIGSTPVTASSLNMSSVRETFSESSKMPRTVSTHTKTKIVPSVSCLSSQSYSFQHPDITAESSSEGVSLPTFSRVEEHYSSSSTLNAIRSSVSTLLESSAKQVIPPFGRDVSTATQKEMSTLPSKSQNIDVLQQTLSESSVIQKFNSSVSRVTQSTVTSAELLAQKRTFIPLSDIKSSTATEGGYLYFSTSASQLPSLALEEETITRPVSSLTILTSRQSSRSTINASKLLLTTQVTQITSSLSPFVARRGYVYFTASSYVQTSSPPNKEDMTYVSSSQRPQSVALITKTLKLSTTHLATDFKQQPSIDTEGGRPFLPTEISRSVASTVGIR